MADGTVRGAYTLEAAQPIRDLTTIRDRGREADRALRDLGTTADRTAARFSTSMGAMRRDFDTTADRITARVDRLESRLRDLGRVNATPSIDLRGFDAANVKLTEIEARLDRLDSRRVTPRVSMTGGGLGGLGGGGTGNYVGGTGAGAGGSMFSSLGGIPGRLPWWAMIAPAAPALLGSATALAGSAVSGALGAGTVGLGGIAPLAVGGGLSALAIRNAVTGLQNITKAQTAYTTAVQEFGRASSQATTAARAYNFALAQNPAAAGAARQLLQLRTRGQAALAPARAQVYRGISGVAFNATRALPAFGQMANTATGATSNAAVAYSGFLTQQPQLSMMGQLTSSFAQDLPVAENALEHMTSTLGHLATAATPFFREALTWVDQWSARIDTASGDTARVQTRMQGYVNSARDWARLTGAAFRTIRDIFQAGTPSGDSMVVQLTGTLDRWDRWINNNPQRVRSFFTQAETTTVNIARAIKNIAGDLAQVAGWLQPIVSRAASLLSLLSGIGPGGLGIGGALAYGGYQGLRGATGGRLPSAGGLASAFVMGGAGPGVMRRGGGGAVAAGAAGDFLMGGRRATNLEVLRGETRGGAFLMGPATVGPQAAVARRAGFGASAETGIVGGLVARSPAAAGAADALLGARGMAGAALRGAARFALPVMAITAALQAINTPGNWPTKAAAGFGSLWQMGSLGMIGSRQAQSLGSMVLPTLATIPLPGVGPLAGAFFSHVAPTGGDLSNPRTHASVVATAQAANAVRTPQQYQALRRQLSGPSLAAELPPQQAQQLQAFNQRTLAIAAHNAGASAASSWQNAFDTALNRGVGPQRAVSTMLTGIVSQMHDLGPRGSRVLAQQTAQWAGQMMQANPKLRRPLERMMSGIIDDLNQLQHTTGTTFADLQRKVFYYNGQILQGSATAWASISSSMVDPAQVAQEKLLGIFGQIQQEAVNALGMMGYTPAQARQLVTQLSSGNRRQQGLAQGSVALQQASSAAQSVTGGTTSGGVVLGGRKRERGGMISGSGLLDTVATPDGGLAAPGEAWIANRHTMNRLSSSTLATEGKTAWEIIRDETRPHSAPVRRFRYTGSRNRHSLGNAISGVLGSIASSVQGAGSIAAAAGGGNPYVYGYSHVEPMSRTDQGLDFTGAGPIQAIGSGTVKEVGLWPGWPGSGGMVYQLDSGPYRGRNVYNMEHVRARVSVGQHVQAGQYIGDVLPGYPWLETGWANASGTGPLTPYNGAADGTPMSGGQQFRSLMLALKSGGKIPLGGLGGGGLGGGAAPQIGALRVPSSGLGGVPGLLTARGGQTYANALRRQINRHLSTTAGAAGTFSGTLSGSVENQVSQFMSAAGFNKIAIAGMLGNAQQESGMNPSTPGGGLWQQISNFGQGAPSLLVQMQTMLPQIRGLRGRMNAAGSPGAAATIFEQGFERAGIPAMANRIAAANAAYASGYSRGGRARWAGWHRHGTSFVTDGPTVIGAGEGGRRERVTVSPAHSVAGGGGHGHRIQVIMQNVNLSSHPDDIESVAHAVGERILAKLDATGVGGDDSALIGEGA